jgi:L-malate glycosyltransferase
MIVRLFHPWIGGAERQAHKLAINLLKKGVQVEIATGWWFRDTPQREQMDGIPIFRNHTMWHMFDIKGLRRFGGYLYILTLLWHLWRRRKQYDLIHVHGLSYHASAAALAGRWFNRPTLVKLANSGRASDILKMRSDQQLPGERHLLPGALTCDRFIATNPQIVQELIGTGVPAGKITPLPNGVENETIHPKTAYALHDPIRLIYLGRLHEQKGINVLLEAVHRLRQQRPALKICLQLLGDGPARKELAALSQQLGTASIVDFTGTVEPAYPHLKQADIFILPSRAEGISNALLEAMSCGLPVIASDVPGNADVVRHGHNGLLFPFDDPDTLAEAITLLIDHPELRQRFGTAARQTVDLHFDLNRITEQYISIYRDLLSNHSYQPVPPLSRSRRARLRLNLSNNTNKTPPAEQLKKKVHR